MPRCMSGSLQTNSYCRKVHGASDFKDKVSCQSTWAFVPEYLFTTWERECWSSYSSVNPEQRLEKWLQKHLTLCIYIMKLIPSLYAEFLVRWMISVLFQTKRKIFKKKRNSIQHIFMFLSHKQLYWPLCSHIRLRFFFFHMLNCLSTIHCKFCIYLDKNNSLCWKLAVF